MGFRGAWIVGLALAGRLLAAGGDEKAFKAFDETYKHLDANRARIPTMQKALLKRDLGALKKALDSVGPDGRGGPEYARRAAQLAELEALAGGGAAPAPAGADAAALKAFDRDMSMAENAHARALSPGPAAKAAEKLRAMLGLVPPAAQATDAYKSQLARLEKFEARIAAYREAEAGAAAQVEGMKAAGAKAAEERKAAEAAEREAARRSEEALAAAAAKGDREAQAELARARGASADFSYPDLQALEQFDVACRKWPVGAIKLRALGEKGCEEVLAELTSRLDGMRAALQGSGKVLERRERIVQFRAQMDEHVLRRIPEPGPRPDDQPPPPKAAARLAALDALIASNRAGFDAPAVLASHLDAVVLGEALKYELAWAKGELGGAGCLEWRQHEYQVKLYEKRMDEAYGGPLDVPDEADEKRVKDLGWRLYQARRNLTAGPLELQDPAVRKKARDEVEALRADLAAVRFPRTLACMGLAREIAAFDRLQEDLVATSDELKRQAPDLDGQLALIRQQFPQGSFAPAFTGEPEPAGIEAWAKRLRNWKDAVPGFLAFFEKAKETSLEARKPEFAAYASWFGSSVGSAIDAAARDFGPGYRSRFEAGVRKAGEVSTLAAGDASGVALALETMGRGLEAARLLAAFERGFRSAVPAELTAGIAAMEKAKEDLVGGYEAARAARRLPQAKHKDPHLAEVATRLLGGTDGIRGLRLMSAPKAYRGWVTRGDWMYLEAWESFDAVFAARRKGKWFVEWVDISRDRSGKGSPDWYISTPPYGLNHELLEENIPAE